MSVRQFDRLEVVVVTAGHRFEISYAAGVDDNIVEIPEIYVRQIFGEDSLNLAVNWLALCLVDFAACLVEQRIDVRIGVVTAIGALRRNAGGVKHIFEDIGV